jgi:chitodextrinase
MPADRFAKRHAHALVAATAAGLALVAAASTDAATLRFRPVADSYVDSAHPGRNFGRALLLRAERGPAGRVYLSFRLRGVYGRVARAILRVHLYRRSPAVVVRTVKSGKWKERKITFRHAPRPGRRIGRLRATRHAGWASVNVTKALRGTRLDVVLTSSSRRPFVMTSRETSKAPALLVQTVADAVGGATGAAAAGSTGGTSGPADTSSPSAPPAVFVTAATPDTISLAWSPSSDNRGVAGYGLYRDGVPAGGSPTTHGTITGLQCGKSYTLAVDAVDAAGNRSPRSTVLAAAGSCPLVPASVFVSTSGDDANPCTKAKPCAGFDRAYQVRASRSPAAAIRTSRWARTTPRPGPGSSPSVPPPERPSRPGSSTWRARRT